MTLIRITYGLMDHQLHPTDAHRAQLEATDVQHVESDLVTFADFTKQILDWRPHVGKHERGRARTLYAHLVLFGARGQSWLAFDDERAELVAIDFCEHDKDVGEAAVCDPH